MEPRQTDDKELENKRQYHREYMRAMRAAGKYSNKGYYARMTEEQKEKVRQDNKNWYWRNRERKLAYDRVYKAINTAKVAAQKRASYLKRKQREKEGKENA